MYNEPFVVGITGGSASGKTTLLHDLKKSLGEDICTIISLDNYYKPIEYQHIDPNGMVNFDLPEAFYAEQFLQDIKMLRSGKKVRRKEYVFNVEREAQWIESLSRPVIIAEGLFVLHFNESQNIIDYHVFIEADEHVMLNRRITRDTKERGYPIEHIQYQWEHHVMPAYRKHLLPYKNKADLLIQNNSSYAQGLQKLLKEINIKTLKFN